MRQALEVLTAYLLLFAPLLFFTATSQVGLFLIYGASVALVNTFACLIRQIQADLKARPVPRKTYQKRG